VTRDPAERADPAWNLWIVQKRAAFPKIRKAVFSVRRVLPLVTVDSVIGPASLFFTATRGVTVVELEDAG
jgi:hypothetical protein